MRELKDHIINPANDRLTIQVLDEPGQGGANHEYQIIWNQQVEVGTAKGGYLVGKECRISFQNGPIAEFGINGVSDAALLAVLIDRYRSFQAGPLSCRENAIALTHMETALLWMHKRTIERIARNVEGTNQL